MPVTVKASNSTWELPVKQSTEGLAFMGSRCGSTIVLVPLNLTVRGSLQFALLSQSPRSVRRQVLCEAEDFQTKTSAGTEFEGIRLSCAHVQQPRARRYKGQGIDNPSLRNHWILLAHVDVYACIHYLHAQSAYTCIDLYMLIGVAMKLHVHK